MPRLDRRSRDYQVLLDTVFGEAREEQEMVQRAVAWVIKNRADLNRAYWGGKTIAGVCQHLRQFGCWNSDQIRKNKYEHREKFCDINAWLPNVYLTSDPTGGADHYYNVNKKENLIWAEGCKHTTKIGDLQFFKSP